jgi:hypothetical protein
MAVTGVLPFGKCNVVDMWGKKLLNDYPPPKKLVPMLSERTDRAIRRAMSTDPDRRPATCSEFVDELMGRGLHESGEPEPAQEQLVRVEALPADCKRNETLSTCITPTVIGEGAGRVGYNWLNWLAIAFVGIATFIGSYLISR